MVTCMPWNMEVHIVYTFSFTFSERVRQIQEKLEEFIQALNHEK
jgi:hypothetical protein